MTKVDPQLSAQLDRDALERYERALQDAADVRVAWEMAGRMLTYEMPNGVLVVDPLWKTLQAAESHAARMARELRLPGRPGRKNLLEGQLLEQSGAPLPPRRLTRVRSGA
jgi:hypothetical protein